MNLAILPSELLQNIFAFADAIALHQYKRLCKRVHNVLSSDSFALFHLQVCKVDPKERLKVKKFTQFDLAWFHWPEPYRCAYAQMNLIDVEELAWDSQEIHAQIPKQLSLLSDALVHLNLFNSEIRGIIIPEICDLVQLESLQLGSNALLCGPIPHAINRLVKLKILDISHCGLTGQLPRELGYLNNIHEIRLNHNHLEGMLPSSLLRMVKLEGLALNDNCLQGQLHEEVGNLTSLIYLHLSQNKFCGPLPIALSKLTRLTSLCLEFNRFEGHVPSEIFENLIGLTELLLDHNQLSGHLPSGILTRLFKFRLNDNRLHGPLPAYLQQCKNLQYLNISNNDFEGDVLECFQTLNQLRLLKYEGNPRLQGKLHLRDFPHLLDLASSHI
ncbi:hypothetical protein BC830DRAFT_520735 [Chytriomyces sp. MP71]|nr:hypothetical protein BC830DRAFT_520735 [Chytriomyces sp. MP71]